jgi:hypothetical protein
MILAPAMIRVLERREQKLRLEVARVSKAIAEGQENLVELEAMIAAVERRARDNASARFTQGSRSVGELMELENNSQSLRTGHAELELFRQRSMEALAKLSEQQRTLAKTWHKEEVRLAHVTNLSRRARTLAEVRQFDADDEAFSERHSIASQR